jgi:hypothetical protein
MGPIPIRRLRGIKRWSSFKYLKSNVASAPGPNISANRLNTHISTSISRTSNTRRSTRVTSNRVGFASSGAQGVQTLRQGTIRKRTYDRTPSHTYSPQEKLDPCKCPHQYLYVAIKLTFAAFFVRQWTYFRPGKVSCSLRGLVYV